MRERIEDIIPLSVQALIRQSQEIGKDIREIDAEAQRLLERYTYPGNIRELQNIIERAVIFCRGQNLTPEISLGRSMKNPVRQLRRLPAGTNKLFVLKWL